MYYADPRHVSESTAARGSSRPSRTSVELPGNQLYPDVDAPTPPRASGSSRRRPPSSPYTVQIDGIETYVETYEESSPPVKKPYRPVFCALAFLGCTVVFIFQIRTNGWIFQPMTCPATCNGRPCNEDGTPCEANLMLGPTVEVLDRMGAKNDAAIFERGEWWRVVSCNWLHAGVIHLLFNMAAIYQLGVDLERAFGFWRIGTLYLAAGIFGTIVSIVFLPGTLSVGASASVFGLVGAAWADVLINFAARGTLRGSGACGLLFATLLNVCVGLTPWVDNFMHLGGLVAGVVVGVSLFAKKSYDERTGERRRTLSQETCALLAALLLIVLAIGAAAAVSSVEVRAALQQCEVCDHLNCVPTPWWSCCVTQATGSCELLPLGLNGSTLVQASCNMTGLAPFEKTCDESQEWCRYDPADLASASALCGVLCSSC